MGNDAVDLVQGALQVPDDPIGIYRHLVGIQDRRPFSQPLLFEFRNFGGHRGLVLAAFFADLRLYLFDHRLQGQLRVSGQPDVNGKVFVDVLDTVRVVDNDLSTGNGLAIAREGHAGTDGE